ncbi:hypothetical protein OSTOST_14145 [Ostertagia ostertagi]
MEVFYRQEPQSFLSQHTYNDYQINKLPKSYLFLLQLSSFYCHRRRVIVSSHVQNVYRWATLSAPGCCMELSVWQSVQTYTDANI